ncbi:MAG: hypothetical protein L6R41_007169 [Letrouitia leprolyta]|nr:MAG: hypothetical protein L6R41_007169 [Letrouitia leprolyta]
MASGPLAGKIALITGGSQGIGKATALRLVKDGASVVINYASNSAPADELVKIIGSDRALAVQANAATIDGIEKMVKGTVDKFGKIDILIPNAGTMFMKDLEHTTEEDFDKTMALNVKGPFFLCQKAVPHMPPGSHIILLSTSLCINSAVLPVYLSYMASKGAIEQMNRVLAKDVARKGITVNTVAPGPTGTELFYRGKDENMLKMIAGQSPFNRFGEPDEIASAMAFLAGKDSSWVSGQVLRVNGAGYL